MSHSPSIDYTQNDGLVYHISDDPQISVFRPRPVRTNHPLGLTEPVVWAIGGRLLHNYLLPRDCPRVSFYAGPNTTDADKDKFLGSATATHVLAIESVWLARVSAARLHCYSLPGRPFRLIDPIADYWVSDKPVTPISMRTIDDVFSEMGAHDVELRLCPSLWPSMIWSPLQHSTFR